MTVKSSFIRVILVALALAAASGFNLAGADRADAQVDVSSGFGVMSITGGNGEANRIYVFTCPRTLLATDPPGQNRTGICIHDAATPAHAANSSCMDLYQFINNEGNAVWCNQSVINKIYVDTKAGDDKVYINKYYDGAGWGGTFPNLGNGTEIRLGTGNDFAEGGPGFDYIYGDQNEDKILGMGGNDHLFGNDDRDGIDGGAGDDEVDGGAGNDDLTYLSTLYGLRGGDGTDTIHGRVGDDPIFGGGQNDHLFGDEDKDQIKGGDNEDDLHGGAGDDTLLGERDNDDIWGDSQADTIDGGTESDEVWGGTEKDTIKGGDGDDYLRGGDGDDTMSGERNKDFIWGDGQADTIDGGTEEDQIWGGTENDTINAGTEGDEVWGEDGDDDIFGGGGLDILHGNNGADAIGGDDGNDFIYGDEGDDKRTARGSSLQGLYGGRGEDKIGGGAGKDYLAGSIDNDELRGGSGDDELHGMLGNDTLYADYPDSTSTDSDKLHGEEGSDLLYGAGGPDSLEGDFELDALNAGADYLYGYGGNDYMNGRYGEDTLRGGSDDDVIKGGADTDHMWGGLGNDRMVDLDTTNTNSIPSSIDDFHGEAGNDQIWSWDATCGSSKYPSNSYKEGLGSCKDAKGDLVECGEGDDSGWIADWMDSVDLTNGDCESPLHASAYTQLGTLYIDGGTADRASGNPDALGPDNRWYFRGERDQRTRIYDKNKFYIYVEPAGGCTYRSSSKFYDLYCPPTEAVFALSRWGEDYLNAGRLDQYSDRGLVAMSGPEDDTLKGSDTVDVLLGDEGDDLIYGYDGDDILGGDAGNDTITGGNGADNMQGDTGADWIKSSESLPVADPRIDCGAPNGLETAFDTGSRPEQEDWADVDFFDARFVDNCENIAEPTPLPYAPPTFESSDL